jgi:hypothetical protein
VFIVFNATDYIIATPDEYPSVEAAKAVLGGLRRSFRNNGQGYYLTANREQISPEEVVLQVWNAERFLGERPGRPDFEEPARAWTSRSNAGRVQRP